MVLQHNYAKQGTKLSSTEIDSETLRNIGRMFRATAEIEDIVSLYLCGLAKISEGHAILILGRAPISRKIQIARDFAKAHGSEELERFKSTVDDKNLAAALEFRNIVAHGALLGTTDEGRIAFRTLKKIDQDETSVTIEAVSFTSEDFASCASALEKAVPWLEDKLSVAEERAGRREKGLDRHSKA